MYGARVEYARRVRQYSEGTPLREPRRGMFVRGVSVENYSPVSRQYVWNPGNWRRREGECALLRVNSLGDFYVVVLQTHIDRREQSRGPTVWTLERSLASLGRGDISLGHRSHPEEGKEMILVFFSIKTTEKKREKRGF